MKAAAAVAAMSTQYPAPLRTKSTISRLVGSSSTTRILESGIGDAPRSAASAAICRTVYAPLRARMRMKMPGRMGESDPALPYEKMTLQYDECTRAEENKSIEVKEYLREIKNMDAAECSTPSLTPRVRMRAMPA